MLLGTLDGGVLADSCRKQKIMAVLDTVSAMGMLPQPQSYFPPRPKRRLCWPHSACCMPWKGCSARHAGQSASVADGAALALTGQCGHSAGGYHRRTAWPAGGQCITAHSWAAQLAAALCCLLCRIFPPSGSVHCQFRMRSPHVHACVCHPKRFSARQGSCSSMAMVLALLNLAVVPAFTVGVPMLIIRYYAFS